MLETVRGNNACYVCGHPIAWTGNIFGGLSVTHGSEVVADVTVVGKSGNQVDLGVHIQCEVCRAINQFQARHPLA